jgi:hypothetical protein
MLKPAIQFHLEMADGSSLQARPSSTPSLTSVQSVHFIMSRGQRQKPHQTATQLFDSLHLASAMGKQ